MKYIELQEALELELNELDSSLTKPKTSDMEYWLNSAVDKFIKTRVFGNNPKTESFEQTQKRIDDLRTLVIKDNLEPISNGYNMYNVILPRNYLFTVGEAAYISSSDNCWPVDGDGNAVVKRTDILEASIETLDRQLQNTFSEHQLRYSSARPLRVFRGNEIELYTDGRYQVNNYELTYIHRPEKIQLTRLPFEEYEDLPGHTHLEIVKLAAHMYLENKANPRYQSYANEIVGME